jgi:hypothetical protein
LLIVVPFGQRRRLVVGDPKSLNLFGREVLRHMNRDFFEVQLLSCLETGVTADDHEVRINHDRLAKSVLTNRCRHGINRVIVEARVVGVGLQISQRSKFDFHGSLFLVN